MDEQTKSILNTSLDIAYDALLNAIRTASQRQTQYTDAKIAFELAKSAKIISGEIQGKNETERKAAEESELEMELDAMRSAERQMSLSGLTLRLAEIEAERMRWKVRLELGVNDTQAPAKEPELDDMPL